MSTEQLKQFQEEGEKEFDKKFDKPLRDDIHKYLNAPNSINVHYKWDDIKTFLSQQTTLAYELGKKEMLEKLTPRIGMLRQWLNEERITDKKMVTSEDIKDWLGLSALNEE